MPPHLQASNHLCARAGVLSDNRSEAGASEAGLRRKDEDDEFSVVSFGSKFLPTRGGIITRTIGCQTVPSKVGHVTHVQPLTADTVEKTSSSARIFEHSVCMVGPAPQPHLWHLLLLQVDDALETLGRSFFRVKQTYPSNWAGPQPPNAKRPAVGAGRKTASQTNGKFPCHRSSEPCLVTSWLHLHGGPLVDSIGGQGIAHDIMGRHGKPAPKVVDLTCLRPLCPLSRRQVERRLPRPQRGRAQARATVPLQAQCGVCSEQRGHG